MASANRIAFLGMTLAAAVGLAACGGSSGGAASGGAASGGGSAPPAAATASSSSASAGAAPGTMFKVAQVSGLGSVLVDARGHTVYILTSDGHHNVPCNDASGCTKLWPDLPLPDGASAATAGPGVKASLLKAKKSSDGETYPTYNGWLMYGYAGDSGPTQGNGQGIKSFGGTWYALNPAGTPVTTMASTSPSSSSGYNYG